MFLKGGTKVEKITVYLSLKKKAAIDKDKDIIIEDLGEVYTKDQNLKKIIENTRIKKKPSIENWDNITAIEITEKLLDKYPDIDLNLIGEAEILLEYKSQEPKTPFFEFIKVALVCIILFFGANLAIINFHEDVNTSKSMKELYFTFTGVKKDNPLFLVIPYSFGIGIGVMMFFSRVFSSSKRRKKEPGPMEIELFLYDEDMEKQILNEVKNNKDKKEV